MLGSRRGCYNWGKTAFALDGSVDAQPLPEGGFRHHYECQTKCAQDGSCGAFTFKYFTAFTTLPGRGHCYFFDTKPETYAGAESRFYVSGPDHCTEFDSTPIDTPRNKEVQIAEEVKSAVSSELEVALSSEVESAVSSAECQLCAAAYERDGGCKYALRGKWFKMIMPDECYLKAHTKSQMNCRNDILDFCNSVEEEETMLGSRRGCYNWGKTAFALDGSVDAQPLPEGGFRHHYECQTKCAQDDSCEAFTFKYFTAFTTLPGRGHCYFFDTKPETYAGAESRFYVSGPDHCTEFDSTPIDTPRNKEVQIAEDIFYEELDSEFAVSATGNIGKRKECRECAAAYDRNGGCKYARKDQWYKIRKPDECYLKLHPKSSVNCRPYVMNHCKGNAEIEIG